jgi:hypothetical protein
VNALGRSARIVGWVAVLALVWPREHERSQGSSSFASRLLGPIASLAAGVEWVRSDLAWRAGLEEEAHGLAERALALDPRSEAGWIAFGLHLAQDCASASREPDPSRRRAWIEEGLAVLRRGEESVAHPEELEFVQGLILAQVGRACLAGEEAPDWPGGARGAWEQAREALLAAARGGKRDAAEQAISIERALDTLER